MTREEQRRRILSQACKDTELKVSGNSFLPEKAVTLSAGRVLDSQAYDSLMNANIDGWLTTGRVSYEFERRFTASIGPFPALTGSSGSSTDLMASPAPTSPIRGDRALQPSVKAISITTGFMVSDNLTSKTIVALIGPRIRVSDDGTSICGYLYAAVLAIWRLLTLLVRRIYRTGYGVESEDVATFFAQAHRIAALVAGVPAAHIHVRPNQEQAHCYLPVDIYCRKELGLEPWVGLYQAIRRALPWRREH